MRGRKDHMPVGLDSEYLNLKGVNLNLYPCAAANKSRKVNTGECLCLGMIGPRHNNPHYARPIVVAIAASNEAIMCPFN